MAVELTTVFTVDPMSGHDFSMFAERFESGVRASIANLPAVVAYFVQPDDAQRTIRFGLRIDGMRSEYIEDCASDVLEEALAAANGSEAVASGVKRVSSELIGA